MVSDIDRCIIGAKDKTAHETEVRVCVAENDEDWLRTFGHLCLMRGQRMAKEWDKG